MKFSEVIKKWEDGWRGYAIDSEGYVLDCTEDKLSQHEDTRYFCICNENWDIAEDLDEYNKYLEKRLRTFEKYRL
ncbi:MAG: hypothetical protein PHT02_00605 [Tissierellia bacterium]|nr:hypothetical protein [Tissierellia bacterium]